MYWSNSSIYFYITSKKILLGNFISLIPVNKTCENSFKIT